MRCLDAVADQGCYKLPRVGSEHRADVADEEPDGERGQVDVAVDMRVDMLGGRRVDAAVREEDEEDAERRDDGQLEQADEGAKGREE